MQTLYTYTKHFKSTGTNGRYFLTKLENNFQALHSTILSEGIPKSDYVTRIWFFKYNTTLKPNQTELLVSLSKYCGIKLQWAQSMDFNGEFTYKTVRMIGEHLRIDIFHHLIDYIIKGLTATRIQAKIDDPLKSRKEARAKNVEEKAMVGIIMYLNMLATEVFDMNADYKLKNWILEYVKLDFKKYLVNTRSFDHATSTRFYKNRIVK